MPLILADNWPPDVASFVCSFCGVDVPRGEAFVARSFHGGARIAVHVVCATTLSLELAGELREFLLATGGPSWTRGAARLLRPALLAAEGVNIEPT